MVSRGGESAAGGLGRADAAFRRGDADAAFAAWKSVRQLYPATVRAWLRPAEILIDARRLDEADDLLAEAIAGMPDDFWLQRARAIVARLRGRDDEALTRYRALRHGFPEQPVAWADLAGWLLEAGSAGLAEAEAAAGMAQFPEAPWLMHVHARSAGILGRADQAADRWLALVTRHPLHREAYAEAIPALAAAGRAAQAADLAREAVRLFPDDAVLRGHHDTAVQAPAAGGAHHRAAVDGASAGCTAPGPGSDDREA